MTFVHLASSPCISCRSPVAASHRTCHAIPLVLHILQDAGVNMPYNPRRRAIVWCPDHVTVLSCRRHALPWVTKYSWMVPGLIHEACFAAARLVTVCACSALLGRFTAVQLSCVKAGSLLGSPEFDSYVSLQVWLMYVIAMGFL